MARLPFSEIGVPRCILRGPHPVDAEAVPLFYQLRALALDKEPGAGVGSKSDAGGVRVSQPAQKLDAAVP